MRKVKRRKETSTRIPVNESKREKYQKGKRVSDNECETGEMDWVIGQTEKYMKWEGMNGNDEESKKIHIIAANSAEKAGFP